LSVFGGKITTFRKLSEHAMKLLEPYFPHMKPAWTAKKPLPGGDLNMPYEKFISAMEQQYPWLDKKIIGRLCYAYGTRIHEVLAGAKSLKSLGKHLGQGLYEQEVRYLIDQEWAQTLEDIIWRRTKLCLWLSKSEVNKLSAFLKKK